MLLVQAFDRLDISFVPLAGTAPAGLTPDRDVLRISTPMNLAPDNRLTHSDRPRHPGDVCSIKLWAGKKQPHIIGEYEDNELMHGASAGQAPLKRSPTRRGSPTTELHWLADDEEELPEEFGTPNDSPFQQRRRLRDTAQRRAQAHQENEEEEEEQSEQEDEGA
jgi:hypothetical protein